MSWKIRHEGSPQALAGLTLTQVAEGLRDGQWGPTDEVMGPQDKAWVPIEDHPLLAELAEELEPPPAHHDDETHIDMNALIDVCLVLLIFFMLTTTYLVVVQKMVAIDSAADEATQAPKKIPLDRVVKQMVRVNALLDAKGAIVVRVDNQTVNVLKEGKGGKHVIDVDKLRAELAPKVKGPPARAEVLLDARDVSWGTVIAIQDAARAAGAQRVRYPKK